MTDDDETVAPLMREVTSGSPRTVRGELYAIAAMSQFWWKHHRCAGFRRVTVPGQIDGYWCRTHVSGIGVT